MKQTLLFTFILLFTIPVLNAQTILVDDESFSIRKLRVKNGRNIFSLSSVLLDEDINYINLKGKIEQLEGKEIDPNYFSLVDSGNKRRYKLVDFSALPNFGGRQGKMLVTKDLWHVERKPNSQYAVYYPSIKDNFTDYDMEGYENVEFEIAFDNTNSRISNPGPLKSTVYFTPVTHKKFYVHMFFPLLPDGAENAELALYYKDEYIISVTPKENNASRNSGYNLLVKVSSKI